MVSTELIKKFESFRACAYKCPAGVWTCGFGSTKWEDGTNVKRGDKITQDRADKLLNHYLDTYVRPKIKDLKLKQCQQEAIESLCYNIGINSFLKSKCYRALKQKDWPTFIKEYDWVKANGKVLPGLLRRRTEELALFFSQGV